jgi:hypothetical protein
MTLGLLEYRIPGIFLSLQNGLEVVVYIVWFDSSTVLTIGRQAKQALMEFGAG